MGTRGIQDPVAGNLIDQILADQARLDLEIQDLRRMQPALLERVRATDVSVPQEGQVIVDPDTEGVKYHSNRVWRDIASVSSVRDWILTYNSSPITMVGTNVLVPSFDTARADANSDVFSLDGNNIISIKKAGFYEIKYGMYFAGTTAYWSGLQVIYDVNAVGGSPQNWRWSFFISGGAGEGSGSGPWFHTYAGGSYPYADLDTPASTKMNTSSASLMVAALPTGISVPLRLSFLFGFDQPRESSVSDSYRFQLFAARTGDVKSTGGSAYL